MSRTEPDLPSIHSPLADESAITTERAQTSTNLDQGNHAVTQLAAEHSAISPPKPLEPATRLPASRPTGRPAIAVREWQRALEVYERLAHDCGLHHRAVRPLRGRSEVRATGVPRAAPDTPRGACTPRRLSSTASARLRSRSVTCRDPTRIASRPLQPKASGGSS